MSPPHRCPTCHRAWPVCGVCGSEIAGDDAYPAGRTATPMHRACYERVRTKNVAPALRGQAGLEEEER